MLYPLRGKLIAKYYVAFMSFDFCQNKCSCIQVHKCFEE